MDKFTEVTHTSYLDNIKNSFFGIIFGIILLFGSTYLLFYNENRSVEQSTALYEMQNSLVKIDNTKYNQKYENKALYIYGDVKSNKILEDDLFHIKYEGLALKRVVSMYQWVENKETNSIENSDGSTTKTTTYTYDKQWDSSSINSSEFKYPVDHINPSMKYKSKTFISDGYMGDFYLSENIIGRFPYNDELNILANVPDKVLDTKNHKSYLYKGENPSVPKIGDMKISYIQTKNAKYTILAKVHRKHIVPFISSNNISLFFVRDGLVSSKMIFKDAHTSNNTLTWLLRALGLFMMFMGFKMIMAPIVMLSKLIPFINSLISGTTTLIAFVLTLIFGTAIIAIAWFAVRPMLSLGIIFVALGILYIMKKRKSKSKDSNTTK